MRSRSRGALACSLALGAGAGAYAQDGREFLIVDCLLPGQIRQLGQRTTYVSARRPVKTSASECAIRGGEYVAYDRADFATSLRIWLPLAEQGDPEASVNVGEIYEKGLGVEADYSAAAMWYRDAAEAGNSRAQVNLGHLYEKGLGVERDPLVALDWYRRAAGLTDAIQLTPPEAHPTASDVDRLRSELDERNREALELRTQLDALRGELVSTQLELDQSRSDLARQRAELDAATAALGDAEQARDERRAELDTLAAELLQRDARLAEREAALEGQRTQLARLQTDVAALEASAAERRQELEALDVQRELIRERVLAGPEITLIDPELPTTRGIVTVPIRAPPGPERQIVGQVAAPAGLLSLSLNGRPVAANELGIFSTTVPVLPTPTTVSIVAVDQQGKQARVEFALQAPEAATPEVPIVQPAATGALPDVDFGNYYALVIGSNDYRNLPRLRTAVNDANELASVLRSKYGFDVRVLLNASRYEILSALNDLRAQLTSEDNLLVYYAGHGELDATNARGHWLPIDAEPDSTANWISNIEVTDILNAIQARHVLAIVDSCYAGALTRSAVARLEVGLTDEEREHWLETMVSKRARLVLTSGGNAPVLDSGGGEHSVFARALLEVLRGNDDLIDGQQLYQALAARVSFAAANALFDQVPEYAPIRYAGHEAGEFFFVPSR